MVWGVDDDIKLIQINADPGEINRRGNVDVPICALAEHALLRELRRTERAGIEAVTAADTDILVVQHNTVVGVIEAVDRADGNAGRVCAVHAGDRHGALAR